MDIRTLCSASLFTITFGAFAQTTAPTAPVQSASPLTGVNLLKNAGAEATDPAEQLAWAAPDQYAGMPYRMTMEAYGETPGVFAKGWGEKNGRGGHCFRFSCDERAEVRSQVQRFDLTTLADTIEKGRVVCRIAGHIAAVGNPHFKGSVVVEFRNVDDKPILSLRTPNQPYDTKGPEWKLTRCSQTMVVPKGTRHAVVYMSAYFDSDTDHSGSLVMDDLSFELILR